jgi:endo-1,4-beta-xylanase
MNGPPTRPKSRIRGVTRLLFGGACAVALIALSAALPGTANAQTSVCSNQTGTTSWSAWAGTQAQLRR